MQKSTGQKNVMMFSDNKRFIGAVYILDQRDTSLNIVNEKKEGDDLVIKPDSTEREVIGWVCTVAIITADGEYLQTFKNRIALFKRLVVNHAKIKPFIKAHIQRINEGIDERIEQRRKCDKDSFQYEWFDSSIEHLVWYRDELKKSMIKLSDISKSGGVTEEQIARAKEYPITNLLEFNSAGFIECIFHNEKTGSLKYYPSTNSVYCHGECHKSADAISVYQELNKVNFIEAVKRLQ